MTIEEQNYVTELEKKIKYLKQNLKARTEEKEQAVYLAAKYISKYVKDNDLADEVEKRIDVWLKSLNC